jgi:hypothetical protein
MIGSYISVFDDYKAAQRLHLKHSPGARARFLGWMIGLPTFTVVFAIATWHESSSATNSGFALAAWLTFCSAVGTFFVVFLRPWNIRRCFRKMRSQSGLGIEVPITVAFDEDAVTYSVPGRQEGRFFWAALQGFAEDSQIALIYIAPKRFLFFPKRALEEKEWDAVREVARNKGLQPHAY